MRKSIVLIALVGIALSLADGAHADVTLESAITRVTIGQGTEWTGAVNIINTGDETAVLSVSVINLERSESGIPAPAPETDSALFSYTLAGWIDPAADRLVIPGRTRARLPVSIRIPPFAQPGPHTAAILLTQESGSGGTLNVSSAVAAAFDVTVSGQLIDDVRLVRFGPERWFFPRGPVPVAVEIANRGSTVVSLRGVLEVRSLFGRVHDRIDIRPIEGPQLLPGSERSYGLTTDVGPGVWRVSAHITHGSGEISESASFVVMPWPVLLILVLALLCVAWAGRAAASQLSRRRSLR